MKKVLGFAFLAALAPLIGCGGAEGGLEEVQAQEQLGSQEQALTHRLVATPANVEILRFGCYDGSSPPRLRWDCLDAAKTSDGSHLNTQCKRQVGANDVEIGTWLGYCYWGGQCVDFVKGMSRDHRQTAQWIQGDNVIAAGTANPGDIIATFSGGQYNGGHVGVFMSYLRNDAGAIIGFRMADQNWGVQAATKHEFYRTSSGKLDADIYYFVRVND